MADPQEIKNLLRATLVSDPGRVTVYQLCKLFREQEGYDVPFRQLGFASLDQYLRTIPDVLQVLGSGQNAEVRLVSSSKSQHVVDMISKQKKPAKKNKRLTMPIYRHQNYPRPNPVPLLSMPVYVRIPFPYRPPTHLQNYKPHIPPYPRQNYSSGPPNAQHSRQPPPLMSIPTKPCSPAPKSATSPPPSRPKKETPPRFQKSTPKISEPTTHHSNKENNPVTNMNGNADVQAEQTTKAPISPERTETAGPSLEHRDDNSTPPVDEECFLSDAEMEINYKVPQIVQVNLMQLIRKYPDGIWCRNLPNLYRQNFNSDINFLEYGFKSLIHMCSELDYIFKYKQAQSGDFKLFHKDCVISKDAFLLLEHLEMTKKMEDNHPPSNLPPFPEDALSILGEEFDSFPPNVMRYEDYIPVQEIVDAAVVDGYVEIRIAEIYDPSKFWFNLNIYNDKLDDMMNDLQDFYKDCDQYLVPSTVLRVGFYCAAIWRNEYHRAKIVNMLPDARNKVKLFFVDYGTVSAMPIEGICYLHNRFKDFPAQAIRGRLAKIYPIEKDSQWTREVSGRFLNIVKEKVLVANVDTVEDGIYDLVVADTTGEEDIYINDTLVYENYAVFSHQEQKDLSAGKKYVPIVSDIHLYPTFDELENALVPTAREMITMENACVAPHLTHPQYFKRAPSPDQTPKPTQTASSERTYRPPGLVRNTSIPTSPISDVSDAPFTQGVSSPGVEKEAVQSAPRAPPGFENVVPNQNNVFGMLNRPRPPSQFFNGSSAYYQNHPYQAQNPANQYLPQNLPVNPYLPQNPINNPYLPQNPPPTNPYVPQNPPKNPYLTQNPSTNSYLPQNPFANLYLPQNPYLTQNPPTNPYSTQNPYLPHQFSSWPNNYNSQPLISPSNTNPPHNLNSPRTIVEPPNLIVPEPTTHTKVIETSIEKLAISKKTLVIAAKFLDKMLHVVLFKGEPHVMIFEIQKNYFGKIYTMAQFRRAFVLDDTITLNSIMFSVHQNVYNELLSFSAIDSSMTKVDVALLLDLPVILKKFTTLEVQPEEFSTFLSEHGKDSKIWQS